MSGVIGKYGEFFKIWGVLMKKFLAIVTSAVLGLVMAITPVYAGTNNNKDRAFSEVKSKFVCKLLLGTGGARGCLASLD